MGVVHQLRHRWMWHRHAGRVDGLIREHRLGYLFLEVTRRCNLACAYCGSDCTGREDGGELTSAEFIDAISQIAADFDSRSIMVAVTGGEPLIKDGVLDLMRSLHRLGFPYGMVTNGQVMTPGLARDLVAAGIGSISISLDATEEINDKLRGRGCFAKVREAVGHLKDAGYAGKLEIISTVTTPALATLDEMRRQVAEMRVPLWRVAPVMPIGRAGKRPDLVPGSREVRGLLEYVRGSRKDGKLPCPEFSEEGFVGYRFEGQVRPYLAQCRAGITVGGIKASGRIGACPELTDAFDQGDIRKDRFKTVWDDGYRMLRDRSWMRQGRCADCAQWRNCRGGALHLYSHPGAPFLRCLYLQCKEAESSSPTQAPAP
jgi:radical SAM protein with 4Fe4S-binding SPASM domain